MPNLAQTTFQTSVQEDLAAVDAYTQTSTAIPIDASQTPNADPNNVAGFLGLNPGSFDATASSVTSLTNMTSKDVSDAVLNGNSDLQSSFFNLDPGLQNQLTSVSSSATSLTSITDTLSASVKASLNVNLSSKNIKSLSGLLDTVGKQVTGSLQATAISAQATFMSNLLKVSVNAGIPNAYARIDAGNLGSTVMTAVTKTALSVAVSTSNVNLLANIASGSMAASVNGIEPNFTSSFAGNFKLTTGTPPSSFGQIAATISSSFGKINASWAAKPTRGGTSLVNANLALKGSVDFKSVLSSAVTLSRSALATTTSAPVSVAATAVPNVLNLAPGSVLDSTTDGISLPTTVQFNNGTTDTYTPNSDGTFNYESTTPTTPTTQQLASLDNSAITNPMALTGLYGQCLASGADSSMSTGLPDPTLNASDSLAANFPLAYTGDLVDLGG